MTPEEVFEQTGYNIPKEKHEESEKNFDYWDMIAFAQMCMEKNSCITCRKRITTELKEYSESIDLY